MSRASVVIDIGHGPGAGKPDGARFGSLVEREIVEDYVQAAIGYLVERHVAVTLRRVGPYAERNTGWQVDAADLYVACHVNAGIKPPTANPYALGLYYRVSHAIPCADVLLGYREHAAPNTRVVTGVCDGTGPWGDRGAVCIREVPAHVPALVFEPGFIDHERHAHLWTSAGRERVGVGLAKGIFRALTGLGK